MIDVIVATGPKRKLEILRSPEKELEKINLLIEEGKNPSKNRNNGIKKAKTDFVAFVDSHSILCDDWIENIFNFFSNYSKIDIVGGPQLTPPDQNWFGKVSGYCLSSAFCSGKMVDRYKQGKLNLDSSETQLTSANLICRRKVFEKIKFDEAIYPGEDPKFIQDAKKSGFKIAYSPKIKVYHRRRETLSGFLKQIFNYGFFRTKLNNKLNPLFVFPTVLLIYLAALPFLLLFNTVFSIPLIFYLFLSISFSIFESLKNKDPASFFLLIILFFAVHISYGLGFLISNITNIYNPNNKSD